MTDTTLKKPRFIWSHVQQTETCEVNPAGHVGEPLGGGEVAGLKWKEALMMRRAWLGARV